MNVLILQCCVFSFCLCTRERVEIMLQFQTLGVVYDIKINLVGALGYRSFFEKLKKIKEKREFLRKTYSFRPNRFFLYGCNSKTNHCKYLNFSPNFYVSGIYIQLNFQKMFNFFLSYLLTTKIFDFFEKFFFEA
ncbi:hypothetical protein FWK35_00018259 [Aphis craccivora]|uniref:Uncharacterized protein n=1 Tax=Aphis craccivora TaxID=307492 RepID=A0A6G0Z321_APHCR|nr:hypothetical protein FWK35_00018259 [Aphis craccivora]